MISLNTVFVLGAGASKPYGFPLASELKILIQGYLGTRLGNNPKEYSAERYELINLGFSDKLIEQFHHGLSNSDYNSVDYYLEHRNDSEETELGKVVIAQALSKFKPKFPPRDDHWYQLLWQALGSKKEDFNKNKVSILTFNYDTSIEEYLTSKIESFYKVSITVAKEMLQDAIKIIHLHGILDEYAIDHKKASEKIKIVHEAEMDDDFDAAQKLLQNADRTYFFGFSYNQPSLDRLNIAKYRKQPSTVYGTCLGLKGSLLSSIPEKYGITFRSSTMTNSAFFNDTVITD